MSGGWEEKLGTILNDPAAMGKIMELAQSLGGGQGTSAGTAEPPPAPRPEPTSGGDSLLDGLDPRLMEMGLRAMAAYRDGDDKRAALLAALRPFVKPQRYAKMDQAIRIAKLSKVIRAALDGWKGGGEDV